MDNCPVQRVEEVRSDTPQLRRSLLREDIAGPTFSTVFREELLTRVGQSGPSDALDYILQHGQRCSNTEPSIHRPIHQQYFAGAVLDCVCEPTRRSVQRHPQIHSSRAAGVAGRTGILLLSGFARSINEIAGDRGDHSGQAQPLPIFSTGETNLH